MGTKTKINITIVRDTREKITKVIMIKKSNETKHVQPIKRVYNKMVTLTIKYSRVLENITLNN